MSVFSFVIEKGEKLIAVSRGPLSLFPSLRLIRLMERGKDADLFFHCYSLIPQKRRSGIICVGKLTGLSQRIMMRCMAFCSR